VLVPLAVLIAAADDHGEENGFHGRALGLQLRVRGGVGAPVRHAGGEEGDGVVDVAVLIVCRCWWAEHYVFRALGAHVDCQGYRRGYDGG